MTPREIALRVQCLLNIRHIVPFRAAAHRPGPEVEAMNTVARQRCRFAAIDRRVRVRQLQAWRAAHKIAHEPEALRVQRMAFLQQLCGKIDAGFTAAELQEAQAALGERNPRQQRLALGTSHDTHR